MDLLGRAKYIASFKQASDDVDLIKITEQGSAECLKELIDWDELV